MGYLIAKLGSALGGFFSFISKPENRKFIFIILIVALASFTFYQHGKVQDLQRELSISQDNMDALTDSLRTYEDSMGNLVGEKNAFQADIETLRELNEELANKVDSLERNPETITDVNVIVERDTIIVNQDIEWTALSDSAYKINWDFSESGHWGYRYLEGYTSFIINSDFTITPVQNVLLKDSYSMNITTGFDRTEEGNFVVYAQTDFPNANFNLVDGAVLTPSMFNIPEATEKNRWALTLNLGYGVTPNFKFQPYLGLGVGYIIYSR